MEDNQFNPENDPDFLEKYMSQMMTSLEGLKTKVQELNLKEEEEGSHDAAHDTKPRGQSHDGQRGRTRRKSILKKTNGRRQSSAESRNCSDSDGSKVVIRQRGRSKRKRRSRDRSSGRRSRSRSRGRSTSSSDGNEYVVNRRNSNRRKSKDRRKKRSPREDKEDIEKLISEVLKKSNSCTEVINRGGKVRVHVEGYPTIVLQGQETKKEKRGSHKKSRQSTDDYDSEQS